MGRLGNSDIAIYSEGELELNVSVDEGDHMAYTRAIRGAF